MSRTVVLSATVVVALVAACMAALVASISLTTLPKSAFATTNEDRLIAQQLSITDLGTLGGDQSSAEDINGRGQVVGYSKTASGERHAFLWENGEMKDLGTLGGETSSAEDINNRGQIVGTSDTASDRYHPHAFLWENGEMKDLGTLGGGRYSGAAGINGVGQVVGQMCCYPPTGEARHAFLWENGEVRDLGTLGGRYPEAVALDVNNHGQVVGHAYVSSDGGSGGPRAFLWQNGKIRDLGTLPGDTYSIAFGINDRGRVVGYSLRTILDENEDYDLYHAFSWKRGKIRDLGTLPGGSLSRAEDVNNRGQVVGWSTSSGPGGGWAFLWQSGEMRDLVTLPGGTFSNAQGINRWGQVAGMSGTASGDAHAVMWR